MKVLLVDDHPLVLSALQDVIRSMGSGIQTECVSRGGDVFSRLDHGGAFDLVMLDLGLADTDGFELLSSLRQQWPALAVIVVSGTECEEDVSRALAMGAMGFVSKRAGHDVLRDALQIVLAGGIYVPRQLLSELAPAPGVSEAPSGEAGARADGPPVRLTRRQAEVLRLLLRGHANKAIAKELQLSSETVKDHVQGVLRALGVTSRTQAVLIAREWAGFSDAGAWRDPSGLRHG